THRSQVLNKVSRSRGGIFFFHKVLADEESLVTERAEFDNCFRLRNPTLRYFDHSMGNHVCQLFRSIKAHIKGLQVPVIHTDEVSAGVEACTELVLVVNFKQYI